MTKKLLHRLKSTTTWGGAVVTLFGIVFSLATGGSWWSGGIALFGLTATCCGHLISHAISKHEAAEKAADADRILKLEQELKRITTPNVGADCILNA